MAQHNINKRLKDHFSHLEMRFKGMSLSRGNHLKNKDAIFLKNEKTTIIFSFVIQKDNVDLPIENQMMFVEIIDKKEDQIESKITKGLSVEESKDMFNELASVINRKTLITSISGYHHSYISSIPIFRSIFFKEEIRNKDFKLFLNMFSSQLTNIKNKKEVRNKDIVEHLKAKKDYESEYESLSYKDEIKSLENKILELKLKDKKLKKSLESKHKIQHLANQSKGSQHTNYSLTIDNWNVALLLIKEHELDVNPISIIDKMDEL